MVSSAREGSYCVGDGLAGITLRGTGRESDLCDDVDGQTTNLRDLLATGYGYEIAVLEDSDKTCWVSFEWLLAEQYEPTSPNASKERPASGASSLDTAETEASPYLMRNNGDDRSFFEVRGCTIKPSTAAQMRTLRARLGIMKSQTHKYSLGEEQLFISSTNWDKRR